MLLRSLLPAAAVAVLLATPANAAPVSVTYTTVGESVFVVPPGVHRVDVSLTGGRGGTHPGWAPGGRGALVAGSLLVAPGTRLFAVVGGAGPDAPHTGSSGFIAGGFNGGGAGLTGGGGASDVRTLPVGDPGSLFSRLAVAGGGGGAAWDGLAHGSGGGGDAGAPGNDASGGGAGGRPGTQTAGGLGGIAGGPGATDGMPGSLGEGGTAGGPIGAGGGGGGFYGGGGGAGMANCWPCNWNGGGGGGSSLVPVGGTVWLAAAGAPAQVTIGYERAEAALNATRLEFPSTQPGAVSPSRVLELTNSATSTHLVVDDVALDSDEFIVGFSSCGGTLGPGAKCRVALRFAPSVAGTHAGIVRFQSNAGPLTIALSGEGVAPAAPVAAAEPAGAPAALAPVDTTTRVTCRGKRCTVAFAGDVPKLTGATRVRATLTRGGRVYATADRVARRGPLRLTLKTRRAVKPGAYKLALRIGNKRTTQPVVAG